MTITAERPHAATGAPGAIPAHEYRPSGLDREAPPGVKVNLTANGRRPEEMRPCKACGTPVRKSNRSGMCRACWQDPANRPALTVKQRYDRLPRQQIKAAVRMLLAAIEHAGEEDPGEGLAIYLEAEPRIRAAVNAAGIKVTARDGASHVAAQLGWTRQRVDERWGERAAARNNWRRDGAAEEAASWARRDRNDQ